MVGVSVVFFFLRRRRGPDRSFLVLFLTLLGGFFSSIIKKKNLNNDVYQMIWCLSVPLPTDKEQEIYFLDLFFELTLEKYVIKNRFN